jgi:hypothetical protein
LTQYSELPINVWNSQCKAVQNRKGLHRFALLLRWPQHDRWKSAIGEIVRLGEWVVVDEDGRRQSPGGPATAFLADYRHRAKPRNQTISSVTAAIRGEPRRGQIWRGPG